VGGTDSAARTPSRHWAISSFMPSPPRRSSIVETNSRHTLADRPN
jgi:hypothetical protein